MIRLKSLLGESFNETHEEDFLQHHYTGHISNHHYEDSEDPDKSHFAKYKKSKYPHLNSIEQHGSYTVEYRQSGEKNEYVKNDVNGDIVRKPDGNVVFMTDAEIKAENLPTHDEAIVAFIGEQCVGLVSNEFGAVGVWVLKPFQKLGIGTSLLEKHVELRPRLKTGKGKFGQMTNAGINLTGAYYRKMAKKYGEDWFEKLKQKKLTELNEGMILIHPKDRQAIHKYLKDMDAEVSAYIDKHEGVVESENLVKAMNEFSDNLPSNTFPFKVEYVFTKGSGKKGQYDKDTNTITLVVAYNCVWHVGTRIGDTTIQHIYNVYSVNFKSISSTFFHEFTHYIQNEYRMAKSGQYEIPDNWSDGDKYFKHGWERQAHAIGYLEKLKQELNINRPESILRQLKKMGVLHNNDLNKLKQSDYKSWKAIMKQAIMATIADIEDRKTVTP